MDLLWKKENGTYVDIFAILNRNPVEKMLEELKVGVAVKHNEKNNELATKYRLGGNTKFSEEKWRMAMKYYNLSLRFAEIGTEDVGLAYANRSHCFLKLGMFDKCITDIEMALKANYPRQKVPKLDKRRAYCLQQIESNKPTEKGEKSMVVSMSVERMKVSGIRNSFYSIQNRCTEIGFSS